MQIELVAPATHESAMLPRLGLGILAALTPPEDEIIYTDEIIAPLDVHAEPKDVDLVGISVDSKTARRSYDIAAAYRRRGIPVVLGGIHPTACPDEAMAHADSVVVGEAEDAWPALVADFKAGALKPIYRPALPTLVARPNARRDLFRSRRYIPFQVLQTMRGCPYPCEFCSVSTANGTTMRFRPADDVLAELDTLGKLVMFADDNVMIHRNYSRDLFTRMQPMKKHWIGQCSLAAIRRLENVELMAKSGCKALFVGFESVDDDTVRFTGKRQNRPAEYKDTIDMRLTMASFAVLTPYPGTHLYRRLLAEGRLIDPQWWLRADASRGHPYYVPKRMTREVLRDGWARAWRRMYSGSAMWRRFTLRWQSSWLQTLGYWPLNFMQRRIATTVVDRIAREDPGVGRTGPRGLVGCDA